MRQQILDEIRRLANENGGKAPGRQAFERETGIRMSAWLGRYWARWGDALAEAGYDANKLQGKADTALLLSKLAAAVRHYGRMPAEAELRMYRQVESDFPSHSTFQNRFESKAEMVEKLRDWLPTSGAFADVAALLPPRETLKPKRPATAVAEGSVYLIRSGAHYKIGRSDELERRVKEIRISLPDAATLEHTIRTDDPAGIESYWHRRFADRRANGEWFKLSSADIAAFKRRKYQ